MLMMEDRIKTSQSEIEYYQNCLAVSRNTISLLEQERFKTIKNTEIESVHEVSSMAAENERESNTQNEEIEDEMKKKDKQIERLSQMLVDSNKKEESSKRKCELLEGFVNEYKRGNLARIGNPPNSLPATIGEETILNQKNLELKEKINELDDTINCLLNDKNLLIEELDAQQDALNRGRTELINLRKELEKLGNEKVQLKENLRYYEKICIELKAQLDSIHPSGKHPDQSSLEHHLKNSINEPLTAFENGTKEHSKGFFSPSTKDGQNERFFVLIFLF